MKIFVKTLKGTNFEIDVKPETTVADVKRYIETSQGKIVYPAEQQMLIHQGKVLKDDTTLDENKVCENSFLVIMLSKVAGTRTARYRAVSPQIDHQRSISTVGGRLREKSTVGARLSKKKGRRRRRGKEEKKKRGEKERIPSARAPPLPAHRPHSRAVVVRRSPTAARRRHLGVADTFSPTRGEQSSRRAHLVELQQLLKHLQVRPHLPILPLLSLRLQHQLLKCLQQHCPCRIPTSAPVPTATAAPAPGSTISTEVDAYGQAASNLVAGNTLEQTIQQILDMGGGTWDRDTVVRALRAAYNNPERAIEYLYCGIPEHAAAPPVAQAPPSGQTTDSPVQVPQPVQPAFPMGGPNANPLDLFPQGLPDVGSNTGGGSLDFLRNSPQFRALQALVQANPQFLQPMLQELGKQNPQILRLIQEHQGEFLRLINEPAEGPEGSNFLGQLAAGMPQAPSVTPEEREAIERLEAMGFDRALVLQVFFACNKNEELAANYLLDHMHEFED